MANVQIGSLPTYTGDTTGVYLVMNDSGNTTTYKVVKENIVSGGGGSVGHLPAFTSNGALSSDEWISYGNVLLIPIWLEAGQVLKELSTYVGASGAPSGTTVDLHLYDSQIVDIPAADRLIVPSQLLTELATAVPYVTPGKINLILTPYTIQKTGFHFVRFRFNNIEYYFRQMIAGTGDGNAWNARMGIFNPFNVNTAVANALTAANVAAPAFYTNDSTQFSSLARQLYIELKIN